MSVKEVIVGGEEAKEAPVAQVEQAEQVEMGILVSDKPEVTIPGLLEVAEKLAEEAKEAPVVSEEVGSLEKASNSPTLDKAAYYVVFADKDSKCSKDDAALAMVYLARFESKSQLKRVIISLKEKDKKLIDIIKGRPVPFSIESKVVQDITIGG